MLRRLGGLRSFRGDMLNITEAQIATFAHAVESRFRDTLALQIKRQSGVMGMSDAHGTADYVIDLGGRFGIDDHAELLRLAEVVVRIGAGFESKVEHSRALQLFQIDGPGWQRINRVQMLLDGVDPELREAAFFQVEE